MSEAVKIQENNEPKIYKISNAEDAAILHTDCTKVEPTDNIKEAKKQMLAIYEKRQATCLGVAAPQIGANKRFFLGKFGMDKNSVFPRKELNRLKYKDTVFMINPVVTFKSEHMNNHVEGCLSIDDDVYIVSRPIRIAIEYQNVDFKKVSAILCGWDAYVFMHELDHLDGITIDQVPGAIKLEVKKPEPEIPMPDTSNLQEQADK